LVVDATHTILVGDLLDLRGEKVDMSQAIGEEMGLERLPESLVDARFTGGEVRGGVRGGFKGGERLQVTGRGGVLVGPVEVLEGVTFYVVHGVGCHGVGYGMVGR
jgi:hypothetical protein